ncbi:MAG: hypothetical protein ABJJ82_13445 [Marinobacter sp.]
MSELLKQLESSPVNVPELVEEWYEVAGRNDTALLEAAQSIASSFIESRLPFAVASSAMTQLMVRRAWEAPEGFWRLFVAFVDLELEEDPGERGRAHVQTALSEVCPSNKWL